MAADGEECTTGLGLGLGLGRYVPPKRERTAAKAPTPPKSTLCLDLSFTLFPKQHEAVPTLRMTTNMEDGVHKKRCDSNTSNSYNANDNSENNVSGCRKKLRLTKEQSTLLENSFKLHSTLNPVQKQALAQQLNLKPRQVEVWFQNRRARTKLKQTEVDCEFLKKCCESLSDENRRLKKELQELRSVKSGTPFYVQVPKAAAAAAATLSMCPSCEKSVKVKEGKSKATSMLDVVIKNYKLQSGFAGTN